MAELMVGVFQRAIVQVAAGEFHEKTIAVVNFRAEIIGLRVGALAKPIHRREWGESELFDGAAQRDFRFDVHHGFGAWGDGELIGT